MIPAGSYVDCEFVEFIPELLRIAGYLKDRELAVLAKIVTRGMQHGLSMPQNMYGYAMPGVQCEGYMTSLLSLIHISGQFKDSIGRSYYAMFSAVRALLACDGVDYSKHSGVIAYFQKN